MLAGRGMPAACRMAARSMCSTKSSPTHPRGDAGAGKDEWHTQAFVVEKLLAACMADAVIGHEDDQGRVEQRFLSQTFHDLAHHVVGHPHRIEVGGPIPTNVRMVRVVGWQGDRIG